MKNRSINACRHDKPSQIIATSDGEHVCKCGVVLEEKIAVNHVVHPLSKMSLYHQLEKGGDPNDMKVVNRGIHIHTSSVSEFSNICNKLGMPNFAQQRAWATYHKFRTRTYFTRAKCAMFSIYNACREAGLAVDEPQIKEAVVSTLGVKNTPSILSVMYELHEDAQKIGIDTNKGHSSGYYLNLAISRKQNLFVDQVDYDRFKVRVMHHFGNLDGHHQKKAHRAVDMTLCEMGVL